MSAIHPVALSRMVRPASCVCDTAACSLHLAPDGAVALICFGCGLIEETEAELLCAEVNAGEATTEILAPVHEHATDRQPPVKPWWPLLGILVMAVSAGLVAHCIIGTCRLIALIGSLR